MNPVPGHHPRPAPPGRDRSGSRQTGASTVELAVATPLLLFLLLIVVQFGVWLHATHIAQAGADQGLAAARAVDGTPAAGRAQADTVLAQLASGILTDPAVDVTAVSGPDGGPQLRVDVRGSAASVVPLLHLPVHVSAQGPREVWTTPNGATP
jgi:Flp pilus assembly protein TadG